MAHFQKKALQLRELIGIDQIDPSSTHFAPERR
jgi:hypothetical protein